MNNTQTCYLSIKSIRKQNTTTTVAASRVLEMAFKLKELFLKTLLFCNYIAHFSLNYTEKASKAWTAQVMWHFLFILLHHHILRGVFCAGLPVHTLNSKDNLSPLFTGFKKAFWAFFFVVHHMGFKTWKKTGMNGFIWSVFSL